MSTSEVVQDQDAEFEIVHGDTMNMALEKAVVSEQIATAKAYPRSIKRSLHEAATLATMDPETAAACFYVLPRKGKKIEGPSVRLAEIMAYSWGNLRVDADIVDEDRTHVTAMGMCADLEKNVAVRVRVKRRITDKHGRRYNEDMIGVASNAAISIALRNAIFKVIPAVHVRDIYQKARKASIGEAGTITQIRQNAVQWFGKAGIPEETLYEILDVAGLEEVGEEEIITLRGLKTALAEGETTVEQLLRRHDDSSEEAASLSEELKAKARKGRGPKASGKSEEEEPPPPTEEQKARHERAKAQTAWMTQWEASDLGGDEDRAAFEARVLEIEEVDHAALTVDEYGRLAEALAATLEEMEGEGPAA